MGQRLHTLYALRSLWFGHTHTKLTIGHRGPFGLLPISISLKTFNSHLYCVGQSGQGKSKFLQHLLFQLTATEWGCGIFDPHADLASDLLAQLASYPKHRPWLADPANRQRLIYLDPARQDYLIPWNILRNPASTPYEIAENIVEAFRRVWPDTLAEAPRFAQILRNAVLVLISSGLTLLELEPLLTDREFRRRLLANVKDPLVTSFFAHQFERWGREQAIFVASVLNKTSAFLFKPQVRGMLGANENCLNFRQMMDEGKVFVVNLGGFHDEETKRLFGSLLLTAIEQAAFTREQVEAHRRRPYFLLIDEFASFCARDPTTLAKILSECRKYRLHLGLAHQTVDQLPNQRIAGALENAKLKVVFGSGRQTAEAIVKELYMPDTSAIKHEVKDEQAQTRTHPLFDPLLEQFERFTQTIQRLPERHALVKVPRKRTLFNRLSVSKVFKVRIPTVPPSRLSWAQLARWKTYLAKQAGQPRAQMEAEILRRAQTHQAPLGTPQTRPTPSNDRYGERWRKAP
jgi:hypothetical protein